MTYQSSESRLFLPSDVRSGLWPIYELLQGTSSHDRRIGAEAIIRGLMNCGAIGLLTTHDLALAHVTDMLGPRGANVHFEDYLKDGRMHFDYRMRARFGVT
jgi:DNA mismatch repair ATPase MutS